MKYHLTARFDGRVTARQATKTSNKVGYWIKGGKFKPADYSVKGNKIHISYTLASGANSSGLAVRIDNSLREIRGYRGMSVTSK